MSMEGATPEVSINLESQIYAIKGGGRPLAEYERAYFEPRFGRDFSQVQVHTDTRGGRIGVGGECAGNYCGSECSIRAGAV